MHVSKLTQKGQTTIPTEISHQMNLHTGNSAPFDYEYHQALESTLSEWSSTEDDEAFNDL